MILCERQLLGLRHFAAARRIRLASFGSMNPPPTANFMTTRSSTKWTHSEYGEFWNLVIAKKCRTLYFNEGWQFSNSCTSAYLSGLKVGAKLFDHAKNTLGLDTAKKLIRGATVRLEDYGFDVVNLQGVFEEIRSFAGLG